MRFEWKILKYKWINGEKRLLNIRIPPYHWMGIATIILLLLENKSFLVPICVFLFLVGGFLRDEYDYNIEKKDK